MFAHPRDFIIYSGTTSKVDYITRPFKTFTSTHVIPLDCRQPPLFQLHQVHVTKGAPHFIEPKDSTCMQLILPLYYVITYVTQTLEHTLYKCSGALTVSTFISSCFSTSSGEPVVTIENIYASYLKETTLYLSVSFIIYF